MAMGNAAIPDALAKVWDGSKATIPGVRLGGIFADKRGYHNTRRRNQEKWPGDYSIKLDMDKKGSALFASAIDLTMSTAEMKKRTGYLRRAALDPRDTRLRALREFIGTLDGSKVYCRIGGNAGLGQGRGSDDWSRDSTHTWHAHLSILRAYANDWAALEAVVSVLSGESWEAWVARKYSGSAPGLPISGVPTETLREGDEGPAVLALQVYLNGVLDAGLTEDGRYGPATTTAVRALQRLARITEDGRYGDDSEAALKRLLEDDMPTAKEVAAEVWRYKNPTLTAHDAYAYLRDTAAVLTELKAGRLREEAILAAVKGLNTQSVIAAVNAAAAADAERDSALLAEAAATVRAALDPAVLAAEIAEGLDHELDLETAERAVETALRKVFGELDAAAEADE